MVAIVDPGCAGAAAARRRGWAWDDAGHGHAGSTRSARGGARGTAQPRLTSGELVLRPWAIEDADVLVSAYSDPEIRRWHVRTMSIDEAQEWIGSREERWRRELGADWAATRDDGIVGRAGLRVIDLAEGSGELAY